MTILARTLGGPLLAAGLLLPFAASAQPMSDGHPHHPTAATMSLTGEGTIRVKPDMATLQLGVVAEAKTAREALSENTSRMAEIVAALRADGIESRDLQTSDFSIEPRYSQPPRGHEAEPFVPEIIGYAVRNALTVRIRDLGQTGALLDKAVTLGANTISGPSFEVADPSALQDSARKAAMRDALRKAELYAEAAGVSLTRILRIDEASGYAPQPMAMAREMKAQAYDAAVPIESGELSMGAQVSISWEIAETTP
jgi:uncharacterized protein YggE